MLLFRLLGVGQGEKGDMLLFRLLGRSATGVEREFQAQPGEFGGHNT